MSDQPDPFAVGFTGTRLGMTGPQIAQVDDLTQFGFSTVHHGDCLGADYDMDCIAKANGQFRIVHPPSNPRLRAWCDGDVILPEKPYHDRNRDIVDAVEIVLACPHEPERQVRGGTWYTIDYAESQKKHVIVVWPDGTVEHARDGDRIGG